MSVDGALVCGPFTSPHHHLERAYLYGKPYGSFSKTKTRTICNPAIPLPGIYLKKSETLLWKDMCIPMFFAALFTITTMWKQRVCPLIDDWIKKMSMYTVEYYSTIKKERNLNICDNMEGRSRGVQRAAHRPHVAQAQHKIVNLLKTLWDFFVITCHDVFNVWRKTTLLLPVWPRCQKFGHPDWGYDAKWNKSEKDKYHMISLLCGI